MPNAETLKFALVVIAGSFKRDISMLNIRRFVRDKDEETWLRTLNESFKEHEDERAITIEDMRIWENSPRFDPEGMFIAEWYAKPVGMVYAKADKKREEKFT